jgi:hypothetical protein
MNKGRRCRRAARPRWRFAFSKGAGGGTTREARDSEEVLAMQASVGDRIVVRGSHVGDQVRDGLIVEVRGQDGSPPYLVRWDDDHEALIFPGPDAEIHHLAHGDTGLS